MFGYKHYLPILKTKQGEFWALKHLKSASAADITPVFELDNLPRPPTKPPKKPGKPKTLDDHLKKKLLSIVDCWGVASAFFLDTVWIKEQANDPAVTDSVFNAARAAGLHAIPVASLAHSADVLKAIAAAAVKDKRGIMLRVTVDEIQRPHLIDAVLKTMSVGPKQVHLLLDYRTKPMDLDTDVVSIPHLSSWATLTAASGVFPASLADYEHGRWHEIPRTDWRSWSKPIKAGKLKRIPAFSDYSVRTYGAPAEGGNPPVVLRYACAAKWLLRIEGYHKDGDSIEMQTICRSLIQRPEFYGATFSAGDKAIEDIASGALTTGGPQQWVQYAINHHLEVVVKQNLPSV